MSNKVETSPLRARILELMSRRAASYERTAHIIIDTDGKTIEAIAAEIITKTALHPNS
jgi:shikimate kinase